MLETHNQYKTNHTMWCSQAKLEPTKIDATTFVPKSTSLLNDTKPQRCINTKKYKKCKRASCWNLKSPKMFCDPHQKTFEPHSQNN